MARHVLYAYVDGSDHHAIAEELVSRLNNFVEETTWRLSPPRVVNQLHENDGTLEPGELPDWELGLNYDLPDPGQEPLNWFDDVEQIAQFLGGLVPIYGGDFIVGIGDNQRGFSEDLFSIRSPNPDLNTLRRIIGVKNPG